MEGDQDVDGCVTSSSGHPPFCIGPSTIQETQVTVEELTAKNMHGSALLSSLTMSTSRLDNQWQYFSSESSELRTSLLFRNRPDQMMFFGLGHRRHLRLPHHTEIQKPILGTTLGPLEEETNSISQRPLAEPSNQRLVDQIRERKLKFSCGADIILQELRPSRFILLPSDKVRYAGSSVKSRSTLALMNCDSERKRPRAEENIGAAPVMASKQQKLDQDVKTIERLQDSTCTQGNFSGQIMHDNRPVMVPLEEEWYTSPEECNRVDCGTTSNVYSLGVFLFELLCSFESWDARQVAMSDLQHRILPSGFLSENPKEAGFCLWLLHPDHSSRPTAREILQSDLFRGTFEGYPAKRATSDNDAEIWDAGTARSLSQYDEHQKRAWGVDFCQVDPMRFASGSDDCSTKLWSIYESTNLLALGSGIGHPRISSHQLLKLKREALCSAGGSKLVGKGLGVRG
ncbi:hypothetical protein CRG98_041313 [Punica granatum]|uniref:Uncharacterized protein n=1 Tax=Punica granatum TaxID=22663 RepID=A0A2I0I491_PUNGR|nr:hypothetical protein CRG98_041313 [Punica granatum]